MDDGTLESSSGDQVPSGSGASSARSGSLRASAPENLASEDQRDLLAAGPPAQALEPSVSSEDQRDLTLTMTMMTKPQAFDPRAEVDTSGKYLIRAPAPSVITDYIETRESYRPGRRHAHHLCTTMIDSTIQNITTCSVWDTSVHRS